MADYFLGIIVLTLFILWLEPNIEVVKVEKEKHYYLFLYWNRQRKTIFLFRIRIYN